MLVHGSRGMGFSLSTITNALVTAATAPLDIGVRVVSDVVGDVGKVGGSVVGAAGAIVRPAAGVVGGALQAIRPAAVPTPVLAPTPGSNLPIYLGGAALALVLVLTMTSKKPAPAPAAVAA